MEITQLLGDLPAALIPVALVLYFFNQSNLKWMQERKEIIEDLLAERKEWLAWQEAVIERQFASQEKASTATQASRDEIHALKSRVSEFILKVEAGMMEIKSSLQRMEVQPKQPRSRTGGAA